MGDKCRVAIVVCLQDQMHNTIGYSLFKNLRLPTATGLHYEPFLVPIVFTERAFRAKMTLAIQGNYDVVVVIGDFFSTLLAQMYKELAPIPTVFAGISDPVKLGLLESMERPGGTASAVIVDPGNNYLAYAEKIALFYPHISRILIPHDPMCFSGAVGRGAAEVAEYLQKKGFAVDLEVGSSSKELRLIVEKKIKANDAVMLLEGCDSGTIARYVAYKCWEYNKICFSSSSRDGIDLGAACSFGANLLNVADATSLMIRRYWEGRQPFGLQPVKRLANIRALFFNEALLAQARVPHEVIERLKNEPGVEGMKVWVNCPI